MSSGEKLGDEFIVGLENYDSGRQDREPGEAHGDGAWRFLTFPGDEDSVLDCHTL